MELYHGYSIDAHSRHEMNTRTFDSPANLWLFEAVPSQIVSRRAFAGKGIDKNEYCVHMEGTARHRGIVPRINRSRHRIQRQRERFSIIPSLPEHPAAVRRHLIAFIVSTPKNFCSNRLCQHLLLSCNDSLRARRARGGTPLAQHAPKMSPPATIPDLQQLHPHSDTAGPPHQNPRHTSFHPCA